MEQLLIALVVVGGAIILLFVAMVWAAFRSVERHACKECGDVHWVKKQQ